MKTITKLIIISLILVLGLSKTEAQQYRKIVGYVSQNITRYAIPNGVDTDVFSDFDLIKMQGKEDQEKVEWLIDNDNMLTIVRSYVTPPQFLNDYTHEIGQTIADRNGLTVLDHNGNVLRSPSDKDAMDFPPLSDEEIAALGVYNNLFRLSPRDVYNRFLREGFRVNYNADRRIVKVEKENTILILDFKNLIHEVVYCKDGVVDFSTLNLYRNERGKIIPIKEVSIGYENFSGLRVKRVESKSYLNYYVINSRGVYEVNYEHTNEGVSPRGIVQEYDDKVPEFLLSVYPNPTSDVLHIEIKDGENATATVTIFSLNGKRLLTQEVAVGTTATLDLSSLPSDAYILQCRSGKCEESQKIIKQ